MDKSSTELTVKLVSVLILAFLLAVSTPFLQPVASSVITYRNVDGPLVPQICPPDEVEIEITEENFLRKSTLLVAYEDDWSFWGLYSWKTKKCVIYPVNGGEQ